MSGTIFNLADAFLSLHSMTHKKLQLLCYYAKAWHLALYDTNIISESFEAWQQGAVNPELYEKYKEYGFMVIPRNLHPAGIPDEFLSFVKEVYESYGGLTGVDLEKIIKTETPWQKARNGLRVWEECHTVIDENDMKSYYKTLIADC